MAIGKGRETRILLLDPPFFRFLNEDQRAVPLGIAYLAGSLAEAGYENVILYNADFDPHQHKGVCNRGYLEEMQGFDEYLRAVHDGNHPLYQEVVDTIRRYRPDVIGISIRTAKFFITKMLVRQIKRVLPGVVVVAGGPHVTANPEQTLRRSEIDLAVRGEGERTLVQLVDAIANEGDLHAVPGISRRDRRKVVHHPDQPLVAHLDAIAPAQRSPFLHHARMAPNDHSNLFSSRGCPFGCTFCDSRTTWSRKVRRHSAARVVEEIIDIRQRFGSSFFSFQDDCLVTRFEPIHGLCDQIERRGLSRLPIRDFRWWCEIHPRRVHREVIARMKEASCVAVGMGAESGSQRSLERIDKASSVDRIREAAHIIREAGLSLSMFFMIGFPWETEEDIEDTVRLLEELRPDNPTISVLTPLPGTAIYEHCRREGLVDPRDEDFLTLFHQRHRHFYSPHISDDRSQAIIRDALQRCAAVADQRRAERIGRFLEQVVARELEGVSLRVAGDGERQALQGAAGGVARLEVTVSQDYARETIRLRTDLADAEIVDRKEIEEKLRERLLCEFPQYAAVEIAHAPGCPA